MKLDEKAIKWIIRDLQAIQTNGKIERFYGMLEAKARYFETLDEFIDWYNNKAAYEP